MINQDLNEIVNPNESLKSPETSCFELILFLSEQYNTGDPDESIQMINQKKKEILETKNCPYKDRCPTICKKDKQPKQLALFI